MPPGPAVPVPVDQLSDQALLLAADRLAADLNMIRSESLRVRADLAQFSQRLRKSTIKLVVNGFVGLVELSRRPR